MRRLLHHALAAAGISVLTAGAVTASLLNGAAPGDLTAASAPRAAAPSSVAATAPIRVASAPDAVSPHAASPDAVSLDAERGRLERETRSSQRQALSLATAASAREKVLAAEHKATVKRERALEKRKAAAEKRKQEEAKKKRVEARQRAEKKARERAAAKHQGYQPGDSPKQIARSIMKSRYGWGASEFSCYNNIIMRESEWRIHADNPTSSAYGIPQALPGSKMASAGPDWRNNPATQIKWGLGYVKSRYGTPCSAWGFKSSHGWY